MNKKGFSLVELIIVVLILAALLAIAIPKIYQYLIKSKEPEARTNLQVLKTKMAHQMELLSDQEWAALDFPATPENIPGEKPVIWPGGASWDKIGFAPQTVRYQKVSI